MAGRIPERPPASVSAPTQLRSLPFDDAAAARYGVLRAELRREGTAVGANDMMIAAIALADDATLVTRDSRELAAGAGLRLVTW